MPEDKVAADVSTDTFMSGRAPVVAQVDEAVAELLRGDPVLVAIAVALVVAVLLGAYAYYRWRAGRKPGRRFERLLGDSPGLAVLVHPNPDPDAMATALGVQTLADALDVEAHIFHPGGLRHHENRAFRTVLGLDLESIDRREDLGERDVVLVDHGVPRGFDGADAVEPIAIIDHHDDPPMEAEFVDVRPDYGACASIFVEYLQTLGARIDAEDGLQLTPEVATALAYGIHTDTNRLTRGATYREFEALRYLFPAVDDDKLDRVANPSIEAKVLESKAKAIINREVRDCYCVSDIGSVPSTDTVPIAAEELLRLEGVTSAVALGTFDGTIYLSGRTTDDRVHMGKTLERTLEDLAGAGGGGHSRMGGGQLPLEALEESAEDGGMTRPDLREALFWNLRDAG